MKGRPPLQIGAHGKITTKDITKPGAKTKTWLSHCYYADPDGVARRVKRTATTKTGAENALQEALNQRNRRGGDILTGSSRIHEAAILWLAQRAAEVEAGDLAPNTLAVYQSAYTLHIRPALGELRLRDATVGRCEAWQQALRQHKGPSLVKTARSVLSGILGYAARMEAIPTNPCRDLSVIPGGRRRPPRALTAQERAEWVAALEASERARRWDLPDLVMFLLATGCRIGEALAVSWNEIDLESGTVAIRWHLVRVKGQGLTRVSGAKSAAGERLLRLPSWAVSMLLARRVSSRGALPVFPTVPGGWRDPSNLLRVFRQERDAAGFGWVTSHVMRKTVLTELDNARLTPRQIADVAGHADPSMTQRVYLGRGVASEEAAQALEGMWTRGPVAGG